MHTTQKETLPLIAQASDVREDDIMRLPPALLEALLRDHTTGQNIIWATDDYAELGEGYTFHDQITPERITGTQGNLIKPRTDKTQDVQVGRKRDKAEIFTPAWICNAQLNLIDTAWFGRKDAFNSERAGHTWTATEGRIVFSEEKGKTWRDYVRTPRLEITCGEGPYLASRYDSTTGEAIPIENRVGIIDRKLRVVGENTESSGDWLLWAHEALMSTYGYEWQGDSLLLARESLLASFIEYYRAKFATDPLEKSSRYAAYIISWNVWQMDGLKGVVPESCGDKPSGHRNLLGEDELCSCEGCRTGNIRAHNGTYCLIRDWHAKPLKGGTGPGRKMRFIDLMKRGDV